MKYELNLDEYERDSLVDEDLFDNILLIPRAEMMSRSDWGARPPKNTQPLSVPVENAFIHHTAGSMPSTRTGEHQLMRTIQSYHMKSKADIAYNFVIMPSGRVAEGRGWYRVGAATKSWNTRSLSVCWAGNYQTTWPTPVSIEAGRRLLAEAMRLGYLTGDFAIRGHRDAASTACPGQYLYIQFNLLDPRL